MFLDFTIPGVVRKLTGEITPVGSSHIDTERLRNLEEMCNTVDFLLNDIKHVASFKGRQEASMKLAGEKAQAFLDFQNIGINREEE